MKLEVSTEIAATPAEIWQVITDIDGAEARISGIKSVEVLERPDTGLIGLKWRETREMFGREATETMWITEAEENKSYRTEAHNHGAIYRSGFDIEPLGEGRTRLTMVFAGEAQTLMAKIMSALMTPFFKGATRKMVEQDLSDIKRAAEAG